MIFAIVAFGNPWSLAFAETVEREEGSIASRTREKGARLFEIPSAGRAGRHHARTALPRRMRPLQNGVRGERTVAFRAGPVIGFLLSRGMTCAGLLCACGVVLAVVQASNVTWQRTGRRPTVALTPI